MQRASILSGIVIVMLAFMGLPARAAGTLSGVVTSNEPGNSAIASAVVKTEGEPSYSAVTDSAGICSISLPAGNYYISASAAGHYPQRIPVTVTDGVSATQNFTLRPAASGSVVNLPPPANLGEPPGAPTAPGDDFPVQFADAELQPAAGAPIIAEANRTVKPDETFTISGTRLTARTGAEAGTDTVVWVWARTSPGIGVLKQAKVWRATESIVTALMPSDIPFGDYLVWVENESGPSAPILINRTYTKWIGPLGNTASVGDTKRIFGKNISYNHGTATSYVYVQPASGGTFTPCPVTTVEPYMVSFTVPSGLASGSYKLYVHNGSGGVYGWSDPLDLTIAAPWIRGTATVSLSPSGGDDTTALQNAIDQLTGLPNGGTVLLSSGSFIITRTLHVKNNVEIKGAGMDVTYILLQLTTTVTDGIEMKGQSHCAITDLTYRDCHGYAQLGQTEMNASASYDSTFTRYKQLADTDTESTTYGQYFYPGNRAEVSNCVFWRGVYLGGTDCWVHNTTMYGDRYYGNGWAALWCQNDRNVIDYNHYETYNWPANPNYDPNDPAILSKIWAKRVALPYCSDMYLAHSTTKDVAVIDNQGEMILFHGQSGTWWGNVISNSGTSLTLRTDGKVDGVQMSINNYNVPISGGGAITSGIVGQRVVIFSGRGIGQMRKILAVSGSTVTVDKPWMVQPDATSVAIIHPRMYIDNIVYANDLNAFPAGYTSNAFVASIGWDMDASGFANSFEANTSHRTYSGRAMAGNSGGPNFWNEARDEQALSIIGGGGLSLYMWDINPKGSVLLGNVFRNCTVEVLGSTPGAVSGYGGEGNVFEKVTATADCGINAYTGGTTWRPVWTDGMTLYRNNTIDSVASLDGSYLPGGAYIQAPDMNQWLVGNVYNNATQLYTMGTGSLYSTPIAMQKSLRFTGYAGYHVADQMVSIANVGVAGMNWTANASDSWIAPTVTSGSTVGAESDMGRLVVVVNTSGLSVGRHWGSVAVTAGAKTAKVGVCLDVLAGAPPQQSPVASFAVAPLVGTSPLSVSFDATASYDPDGSIQSYAWDFGDGSYGSGSTASHTYSAGNYTASLIVTDNAGAIDTMRKAVSVSTPISNLTLVGTPGGAIDVNTSVTLTATSTGGYQTAYKFLINNGNGWTTLSDYQSSGVFLWTPSQSGYYRIKAYAKTADSTKTYDLVSQEMTYPVGILPATGIALWLKADAGVTKDTSNMVSDWADQVSGSSKHVTQSNPGYQPQWQDGVLNGRPVIHFSGNSCGLATTAAVVNSAGGFTAFTVARYTDTSANYQYFWWDGTDSPTAGYGPYVSTTQRMRTSWGSSTSQLTLSAGPAKGTWYRITSRYRPGLHEAWLDGTATGTNGGAVSNLGTGFGVGNYAASSSYQGLIGDVAEILIYSRNLSETERQGVESYLANRWASPTAMLLDRLRDVKALGDGVLVSITSAKVSTVPSGVYSDGGIYVCDQDRACGMKVTGVGTVGAGDSLTLTGTMDTDQATGERVLRVSSVSRAAGTVPNSLGMNGKAFCPSGLLVRLWGKVVSRTNSYLRIDDGSGVQANVEVDGLLTPIASLPNVGSYVSATGPAGYMAGGIPAVRVRSTADLVVY